MTPGPVLREILHRRAVGRAMYWVLLDPDDFTPAQGAEVARKAQHAGADGILIGGSLLHTNRFDEFVARVKEAVRIPAILFPGDAGQLSPHADAVLFLSLVSGRNPVNLIGEHVKAAPKIREFGIEVIPTAYLLVESGAVTSVEFMSNTRPIPRAKPAIAAAHALAAQYMGMSVVYLEAGSGAPQTVPDSMVRLVREQVDIPLIVGGGIRTVAAARAKLAAGADIVVTGNLLRHSGGVAGMKHIAALVRRYRVSRDRRGATVS